jgi:WXG100 family type VII secretion target
MSYFKVTPAELQSVAGQLQQVASNVQQCNQHATQTVQNLVATGWQGISSSTYNEHVESWQQSARNIEQQLDDLGKKLLHAASTYQCAEDQVRASV